MDKMILDYNTYIEHIKEGLIYTHNIEKYYSNIEIELDSIGVENNIEIQSKFVYILELVNVNDLTNDKLEYIINLNQNLLGYYPSYIWVKNNVGWNSFKFDKKYLNNKYESLKIRFEAKYEDGLYKNDIDVPINAYHLSPINKEDKILKNGLSPKSYNRKSNHPERIYLFDNLDNVDNILTSLKINNNIETKYNLYEIEMDDKMIIHSDPNYKNGFYTTDNISPYKIKKIKNNNITNR